MDIPEIHFYQECLRDKVGKDGYTTFSLNNSPVEDDKETFCLLKELCEKLLAALTVTSHSLPFQNIFECKRRTKEGIETVMDKHRAQCHMKDINPTSPVYGLLSTIVDYINISLTRSFGVGEYTMKVDNVVILRSLQFGHNQETHLDMNVYTWGNDFDKSIYFGMLALQDGTRLTINKSATKHFKEFNHTEEYDIPLHLAEAQTLVIRTGECILCKVEVGHFGLGYLGTNHRIHFTYTPIGIEKDLNIDPNRVQTNDTTFFTPTNYWERD